MVNRRTEFYILLTVYLAFPLVLLACTQADIPERIENMPSSETSKPSTITDIKVSKITEDEIAHISKEELLEKINASANVLVIDIREKANYELEHIIGAVHVPLSDIKEGNWLPTNDTEIIIYCGWPGEDFSARVALELINKGFFEVKILEGDFVDWVSSGYPTDRITRNWVSCAKVDEGVASLLE